MAQQVAAELSNSFYVEFRGTGHGQIYDPEGCGMSVMASFLDRPTRAPETACVEALAAPAFVTRTLPLPAPPTPVPPTPVPTAPSGVITAPDTGSGMTGDTSLPRVAIAGVLALGAAFLAGASVAVRRATSAG
jgi:hypothetical protein